MNYQQLDPVQVGLKMAELILALEAGRAEAADAVAQALGETTADQLTIRFVDSAYEYWQQGDPQPYVLEGAKPDATR